MLHLLEQVRHYCEACWSWQENHERGVDQEDNPSEWRGGPLRVPTQKLLSMSISIVTCLSVPSPVEHQICPAVCVLMKLSFDEEHRHAMNELGELVKDTAG